MGKKVELKEYFEEFKESKHTFAYKVGCSVSTLYFYISKHYRPRQKRAEKIEKETGGRVTVFELRGKDDRFKRWTK